MKTLLLISAILSFCLAALLFVGARGAMHEATGATFFVVSAVSFVGAGIIEAIQALGKQLAGGGKKD